MPPEIDALEAGRLIRLAWYVGVLKPDDRNALAVRLVEDAEGIGRYSFLEEMRRQYRSGRPFTPRQAEAVINIFIRGIEGQQRRFCLSRPSRSDRCDGIENCLICGAPLDDDVSVARCLGPVCYRRALGKWS